MTMAMTIMIMIMITTAITYNSGVVNSKNMDLLPIELERMSHF
jgi:hypothetical protein